MDHADRELIVINAKPAEPDDWRGDWLLFDFL